MTKTTLTAERLIQAIRGAYSLEELKHLVGHSDEENEAARIRLERMDILWKKPGDEKKAEYMRLMAAQDLYESDYA